MCNYVQAQTPDKLAKEANALFGAEKYIEATPKYLQLLSLEPRSHFYNYRYGACLLFNSEKKPDALKHLKFAVTDSDIDPEAHYFLARAYHLNYYFDKAIREYRIYKNKVKDKTALKKDVDRQIEMCQNGLKLMSRVSDVIVKERKTSSYEDFFRLYNLKDIGGSIIVTEDFQSKVDKKRGHKPVIHIAENATIIFYSSYGNTDEGQKDIYYRTLNNKGEWGDPVKLPNAVNTPFDEDFPYLDPNGEYLYFSSKGHNSMGGYDIFRVPFDKNKISFGLIDNLDFAISSPDDDLFYVVDKDYKHAYFASSRQSEGGKIHVYRVMVNKFNSNAVMYAGNFLSTIDPNAKSANIAIKETTTGRIIDNVKTNSSTGALAFSLPRGGSYEFIIQTDKTKTPQVIPFEAPFLDESVLLKLNFLEEQAGLGTQIRIVLDVNYRFSEDERSDVLASIFLAKSELLPNVELQDLFNAPDAPIASNADVLSELKIEKYHPHELAQIAESDLNRLKDNFRRNEQQRDVFLAIASDAIEKAKETEVRINELVNLSETRGLTEKELQELKTINDQRNRNLNEAKIALDNANKFQANTPVLQAEINRADAILQKMNAVQTKADLVKLNDLSEEERVYMLESFNQIPQFDAAQTLRVSNNTTRIREIDGTLADVDRIQAQVAANQQTLNQLQEDFDNAKKKDKPAIQAQIDELLVSQDALNLQVNTKMQHQNKLLAERDSLRKVNEVYQQSLSIDPNVVASNGNSIRLINAKLSAEKVKKVDQTTQTVLANNVVPDKIEDELVESNIDEAFLDEQLTYFENKRNEFNDAIEQNDKELSRLDAQINKLDKNDHQGRLKLEQEKLNLVQEQINNWNGLAEFTEDNSSIDNAILRFETQASAIENTMVELTELVVMQSEIDGNRTSNEVVQSDPENSTVVNQTNNSNEEVQTNLENNPEVTQTNNSNEPNNNQVQPSNSSPVAMNQSTVVGVATPEMQIAVDEIAQLKERSDALARQLEDADSRAEANKILKEIAKIDGEIAANQYVLLISEVENYESAVQEVKQSVSSAVEKDPLLKAELLMLNRRKNEAQEVVEFLENSSRSDRDRVLVQAVEIRQEFLNQIDIAAHQIAVQNEIARVVQETGLNQEILVDPNRLDYAMLQLNEEIDRTKAKIKDLESSKSAYKKSELPLIEQEIQDLKDYVKELEALRSQTKRAIENNQAAPNPVVDVPELNSKVDADVLNKLTNDEIVTNISNPEFVELRNDLVSFTLMQNRLQNLVNQQILLRSEMTATVLLIAQTEDETERIALRSRLDALSVSYQQTTNDIAAAQPELAKMQVKIDQNALYQQNPMLYHTLALSTQVQETLLQPSVLSQSSVETSHSSAVLSGITFLSAPKPSSENGQFGLNPVNIPGMIYKVQIGAFNKPVDLSTFAEFEPVTTDQVGNNVIRYSAGIFYTKGQAFESLGPIKGLGYSDAFVVAYCDGVRYTVAEADELLRQGKCSLNQDAQLAFESRTSSQDLSYYKGANAAPAEPLELAEGLLFTVQIGVFNAPISHERLQNVMPLNCQKTERNQIRYSVGRFDAVEDAIRQRDAVRPMGFTDAFVVAYFNGERITIAEARNILETQGTLALHSQQAKLVAPSAVASNTQVLELAPDTLQKIELLSNFPIGTRFSSNNTYTKIPESEILMLRKKGYWAYYEQSSGRVVTSLLDDQNTATPAGYTLQNVYRGFAVENANQVALNNLMGFDQNTTYYHLEMSWELAMPRLIAYYLEQHFLEVIAHWDHQSGKIQFMPLTFAQKEKIRRALINLGEVQFTETILTF